MPLAISHSTPADVTFSAAGAIAWDAFHTLSGVASVAQGGTGKSTTAPSTTAYAATITPAVVSGDDLFRVTLTGALTLNVPTGGTDGNRMKFWLVASGADRVLTLNAAIKIPGSSFFTSPVTISSGTKAKLLLEYDALLNGGQWELTSFINGF